MSRATTDEMIDSRDLIAELEEYDTAQENDEEPDIDQERAEAIRTLADAGLEDWEYGAQLIREDYFTTYAQELAEDIGAMPSGNAWPSYCIDWEWAARELQTDYTTVEFLGSTYYVR